MHDGDRTEVVAEVPSNIALVKYWGKRDAAAPVARQRFVCR